MFSLTIYNYNRYKFYRKSNLVPELKELSLNPYLKATTEMYLFNRNESVQQISTNNLVLPDDWVLIKESIFFFNFEIPTHFEYYLIFLRVWDFA